MTTAKNRDEPSMEEILASIRRIIADDGEDTTPQRAAGVQQPERPPVAPPAAARPEPSAVQPAAPAAFPTPPRQPPAPVVPPEAVRAAASEPRFVASPGDEPTGEVIELDQMIDDDGEVTRINNRSQPAPPPPLPSPPAAAAGTSKPMPDDIGRAFGDLRQAVQSRDTTSAPPPRGGGELTVGEMVRDAARPIIRQWLDQHMRGLVEEMIADEIRRVTGAKIDQRAQGD